MNDMQKWMLFITALMGGLAVAAGAFGAHALKRKLDVEMLAAFEVGVRYQMYHALAIGLAVFVSTLTAGHFVQLAAWFFLLGTIVFSGSLYILTLTGVRTWGAITPIGGLLLIGGWLCLAIAAFEKR